MGARSFGDVSCCSCRRNRSAYFEISDSTRAFPGLFLVQTKQPRRSSMRGTTGGKAMRVRAIRTLLLAGIMALVLPAVALAQAWPSRPVTFVVPFPAGGNIDVLARSVAAELSEKLGQQFIVDNRAGAGGNI